MKIATMPCMEEPVSMLLSEDCATVRGGTYVDDGHADRSDCVHDCHKSSTDDGEAVLNLVWLSSVTS